MVVTVLFVALTVLFEALTVLFVAVDQPARPQPCQEPALLARVLHSAHPERERVVY